LFDVERILLTDPDDPKIREVTTRMSRYVCNLENDQERLTEKAYLVETKIPIVFNRHTPDKVTSQKHIYLITNLEKDGSKIFLVPGVIALIMFLKKEGMNEDTAKTAQKHFLNYFTKRINGAYPDGNDLLINNKKLMGMTIMYNNLYDTVAVRFMLTMTTEYIPTLEDDLSDKKYIGIGGVCEETDLTEEDIREMANDFINEVINWRPENE